MNFSKSCTFISSLFILTPLFAGAVEITPLSHSPDILQKIRGQALNDRDPFLIQALGLDIGESIVKIRSHTMADGREITRFHQAYRGIPVWGKQILLDRDSAGQIQSVKGKSVSGIARDITSIQPTVAENTVITKMRQHILDHLGAGQGVIQREKSELVIFIDDNDTAHLAYAVEFLADTQTGGHPTRPISLIDAHSGQTLFSYDALAHQSVEDCSSSPCELLNQSNISGTGTTRGKNGSAATWDYFEITIPDTVSEGSKMTVTQSGGSGDADLYVKMGSQPTTSSYDCRPYLSGNNESCVHNVSPGQTWHIGVYAYSSFSGVTLTASVTPPVVVEKNGDGPGGNEKTGLYYYGVDYGSLTLKTDAGQCEMLTNNVKTVHLYNGTSGNTAYRYSDGNNCYQDSDPANGAYSPLNDAHYFGGVVYDMYQEYLGVAPLTFQLSMRVHYSTNYENAFWDGSAMTFGDGYSYFYPLVSLDVSAHEVSHGFTEQNSNLIYSGQSGGMNESFSDIAGEAAEFFMKGMADFEVGADIFKGSGALRYMDDPTLDGQSIGHVANYTNNMDVHYSSGIFNKAFYELAVTNGWGVPKAFQVFAWANMNCWTPDSTFQEGAQCVLDETVNQNSPDYPATGVVAAFAKVGISLSLPALPDTPATPSLTVTGYDQIDLSWNSVANVTGYDILRSENNTDFSAIASVGSTTTGYADSGLQAATTYYYKVRAINAYGSSESNSTSATTDAAPAIVLQANAVKVKGVNQAELSWNTDTTVTIYRDGTEIATVSGRSYTDNTGQKGGMSHTYQVCDSLQQCSTSVTLIW